MLFFIRSTVLAHSCMPQKIKRKKTKEVVKKNGEIFCFETKEKKKDDEEFFYF